MPRSLRNFFYAHSLQFHFALALGLGLFVRLLSAWFVYGPQALDDYKHGVWPAYQLAMGLPVDLPEYRSFLLVGFLSIFVKVAEFFGGTSALAQVRAMYIGLALTSLFAIWGTFLLAKAQRSRIFGASALYLVALYPLMPFVSTRAFGEAVAMSLVAGALGVLAYSSKFNNRVTAFTLGFFILGLATLFRFHVGLIYLTTLFLFLWQRQFTALAGGILAGLMTLALQAGVDLWSGKGPLETLFVYLRENQGGAAKYGVMPWYNPLLFVVGLSLFPFSLPLFRSVKTLWRRQSAILLPAAVFLFAHCLVAHKEERFLYPILVIELWALAALWSANALRKRSQRLFTPVLIGLTILILPVTTLVNTQEGEIEPPAYIESRFKNVLYMDHESLFGKSRFQFYFLRPPSRLEPIVPEQMTANQVDDFLNEDRSLQAVALLTSKPELQIPLQALAGVRTIEAQCLDLRQAGSMVDRLLYSLNPKHNQRRRPTWYLICERVSN